MFAPAQIRESGTNLYVEHGSDSNLYIEFRNEAVHQPFESETEGRPIFKDTAFIRIMFAGDKTKVVDRPVNEDDKMRFRKQWEAFQREESVELSGTPLSEWTLLSKSEVAEFKAMNIFTVEALAAIPDSSLSWLGARTRRDQAVAFLEKHGAEIAKRDATIASLEKRLAVLESNKTVEENLENAIVKKRSRPVMTDIIGD